MTALTVPEAMVTLPDCEVVPPAPEVYERFPPCPLVPPAPPASVMLPPAVAPEPTVPVSVMLGAAAHDIVSVPVVVTGEPVTVKSVVLGAWNPTLVTVPELPETVSVITLPLAEHVVPVEQLSVVATPIGEPPFWTCSGGVLGAPAARAPEAARASSAQRKRLRIGQYSRAQMVIAEPPVSVMKETGPVYVASSGRLEPASSGICEAVALAANA